MSCLETDPLKSTETQWVLNEERTIYAPQVPSKVKISLSEHIRHEVAALLTAPSFKREMAQEMMLLSSPVNLNRNTEYVKLEDLKDIVSQLISRNVVGHSLTTLEENSKRFGTVIKSIEQKMVELCMRVDQLERDMQELYISEDLESTSNDVKTVVSSPMRLAGGGVPTLAHPCNEDSAAMSIDQLYMLGTKPEKLRIYNELICKYHKQLCQLSFSDASTPCSSSSTNTAQVPPLTKSKTVETVASPSPPNSKAECSQLQHDCTRRAAERRQFETNMLMYRKSQFSMQLNNRINKYSFTLWKKAKTPRTVQSYRSLTMRPIT